ncbi:MAG: hypothetical protein JWP01_3620 [Myxococcales bacterium]|nr:hypothetical protein [Myxococcales bacterium]
MSPAGLGVLVIVAAVGPAAATPPCPPAVIVAGEPATAAAITRLLGERGILAPLEGCPAERASVDSFEGEIVVSIVDVDGRRTQRQVADLATAAALIETFSVTAPLPSGSSRPKAPPPLEVHDVEDQPEVFVPQLPGRRTVPGAVGVSIGSSFASDGSVWLSSSGFACVDLGRLCVGGAARYSRDAELSGRGEKTETTRSETDVLLSVEVPIHTGRWSFSTGLGLGIGWLRVRRDVMTSDGPQQLELDTGGLRAELRTTTSVPLRRGVSLTLGVALGFAPGAHTQSFREEGFEIAGEPRTVGRIELGLELGRR